MASRRGKSGPLHRLSKRVAEMRTLGDPGYPVLQRKKFWLRLAGIDISARGVAIGSGVQMASRWRAR
jgi:hypothetical protein